MGNNLNTINTEKLSPGDDVFYVARTATEHYVERLALRRGTVGFERWPPSGDAGMVDVSTWGSLLYESDGADSFRKFFPHHRSSLLTRGDMSAALSEFGYPDNHEWVNGQLEDVSSRPEIYESLVFSLGATTLLRTMSDTSYSSTIPEPKMR